MTIRNLHQEIEDAALRADMERTMPEHGITNTSDPALYPLHLEGALRLGSGPMVEGMEREGQRELVAAAQTLPTKGIGSHRPILEAMGFEIKEPVEGDELFTRVIMPMGWKKMRTDHSLWSNLVDAKGRVRGSIFYKAAFYDRDAFFHLKPRYQTAREYEQFLEPKCRFVVRDGERVVFATEWVEGSGYENVRSQAERWKQRNEPLFDPYPRYDDPFYCNHYLRNRNGVAVRREKVELSSYADYEDIPRKEPKRRIVVKDGGDHDRIVFATPWVTRKGEEKQEARVKAWMAKHLPDADKIAAYW